MSDDLMFQKHNLKKKKKYIITIIVKVIKKSVMKKEEINTTKTLQKGKRFQNLKKIIVLIILKKLNYKNSVNMKKIKSVIANQTKNGEIIIKKKRRQMIMHIMKIIKKQ